MSDNLQTAAQTLDHAKHIITGGRQGKHGKPERCFDTIAIIWSAWITAKTGVPVTLSPADVCWLMALLKAARASHGASGDHAVDGVGYLALANEMDAIAGVTASNTETKP